MCPLFIFVYCLKLRVFTNDSMNMHAKRAQKSKRRMEVINVKIEKKQLLFGFGVTKALNPNGKTWLTHKRPNSLPLVTYWSLLFSQNLFEHFQFRITIFSIEKYFFPLNFISLNFELIATLIQCKSVLSSSKFGFWGIFVPLKNQSILITH